MPCFDENEYEKSEKKRKKCLMNRAELQERCNWTKEYCGECNCRYSDENKEDGKKEGFFDVFSEE